MNHKAPARKDSPWLSIALNVLVPSLIMSKLSKDHQLGPKYALILALAFPLVYFFWELRREKKLSALSIIGFLSILLTGGIALLELPSEWVAVKEASVPLLIGLLVYASQFSAYSVVKKLIYNEQIFQVEKINLRIDERGAQQSLKKLLDQTTLWIAGSFMLSACLNFALAKMLIKSATGTEEFNAELGKMTALSFPVVALPSMLMMLISIWLLVRGIRKITDLGPQDIFQSHQ